jgi:hypothetical protein
MCGPLEGGSLSPCQDSEPGYHCFDWRLCTCHARGLVVGFAGDVALAVDGGGLSGGLFVSCGDDWGLDALGGVEGGLEEQAAWGG